MTTIVLIITHLLIAFVAFKIGVAFGLKKKLLKEGAEMLGQLFKQNES